MAQLRATASALMGLVRAHVELAKAEAEEIKDEVARAAGFLAAALAALLLLAVFLPIVTMLFLGEWLFGSIGWGVLLGSEMLLSVALTAVVVALRLDGYRRAVVVATVTGLVTFIVLGASLPHLLWARIAESTNLAVDPLVEPLLVAMAIFGVIGAILGLVMGARATGFGGAVVGLFGGVVAGGLLGAFLAVDFGWRVGAALGFAAWYATYMGVLAAGIAAKGIDPEQIKARFWPQATIDTTMETIEWAKQRNPLGPRS